MGNIFLSLVTLDNMDYLKLVIPSQGGLLNLSFFVPQKIIWLQKIISLSTLQTSVGDERNCAHTIQSLTLLLKVL
jgi:hypothetical protein